jgi:hypothetical protein
MRDAAGLDDVPEKVQVREIEPHAATFLFGEGRLYRTHIATRNFQVQASRNMKYRVLAPDQAQIN